jgi:hypothetical protein
MNENEVVCSRCKNPVGYIYSVGSEDLLMIGGVLIREVHGICVHCGTEFHFSLAERKLQRLLELVTRQKSC